MKFIKARKFNEINDWLDDDTLNEIRGYESSEDDNYEVYDLEANDEPMQIYEIDEGDEAAMSYLADDYAPMGEPFNIIDDSIQEV